MKYLLDTHTLLWAITGNDNLDDVVAAMIDNEENDIYYSVISPWEVEIKHHKHPDLMPIGGEDLINILDKNGFKRIDIKASHIKALSTLKEKENNKHADPFDRILLAQAKAENIALVSHDKKYKNYDEFYLLRF